MGKSYYKQLIEISDSYTQAIVEIEVKKDTHKETMRYICEETSEHMHNEIVAFADKLCDEIGCDKSDNSPFDSTFCKKIEELIAISLYRYFENKGE